MNPPPTSLPTTSLWVIPMHQPQASCTLCQTWTGDSILTWQYTCYNSHSPKSSHPLPLPLSPKVWYTHLCLFSCLAYRVVIGIVDDTSIMGHQMRDFFMLQRSFLLCTNCTWFLRYNSMNNKATLVSQIRQKFSPFLPMLVISLKPAGGLYQFGPCHQS